MSLSCREMALNVEYVEDGGVRGEKSLGWAWTFEALHFSLSPPRWLMRVFSAVIFPTPTLMTVFDPDLARSRALPPQVVGDYSIRNEAVLLQQFAHQFQRRMPVSP